MEITYTRVGDYYLPNLVAPESPKVLFYDHPSKDRCAGFAILSYFSPIRILASSELASRMTVFSSPFRLAFRASSARENS